MKTKIVITFDDDGMCYIKTTGLTLKDLYDTVRCISKYAFEVCETDFQRKTIINAVENSKKEIMNN